MNATSSRAPVPPRLSLTVARDAPVAVVFRQGPSRWVRMILWDLRRDRFELGQWLHARVAAHHVSANGEYVLSFVQGYRQRDALGTWIALSRPPWFSALAVWKVGDSWGGRCLFTGPRSLYLGRGLEPVTLVKGRVPRGWRWTSDEPSPSEIRHASGWTALEHDPSTFVRRCGDSRSRVEANALRYTRVDASGERTRIPGRPFGVEVDLRGRILEARDDGKLYVSEDTGVGWTTRCVLDTNGMVPEPLPPPKEALRPWR